jgi:hypothetical protein
MSTVGDVNRWGFAWVISQRDPNVGCLFDILICIVGGVAFWMATAGAWILFVPFALATVGLLAIEVRGRF